MKKLDVWKGLKIDRTTDYRDRTYEDFFRSLGFAVILCTLLVSVGKYVTSHYFVLIILCLVVLLVICGTYDCQECQRTLWNYKRELRKKYSSSMKILSRRRNATKGFSRTGGSQLLRGPQYGERENRLMVPALEKLTEEENEEVCVGISMSSVKTVQISDKQMSDKVESMDICKGVSAGKRPMMKSELSTTKKQQGGIKAKNRNRMVLHER